MYIISDRLFPFLSIEGEESLSGRNPPHPVLCRLHQITENKTIQQKNPFLMYCTVEFVGIQYTLQYTLSRLHLPINKW